jgi:hypothetical protein
MITRCFLAIRNCRSIRIKSIKCKLLVKTIINNNFYPEHLGPEFITILKKMTKERIFAAWQDPFFILCACMRCAKKQLMQYLWLFKSLQN